MGFDSQIISHKTYTLFVLITLLMTFSTTPLISKVYSPKYRVPIALDAPSNVEFSENTEMTNDNDNRTVTDSSYQSSYYRLLVTITNTKSLPGLITILHLLNNKPMKGVSHSKLMVHSLRVMEYSERSSSIQMATDATTTTNLDPISTIIRTFGQLNNINIIANLIVARPSDFSSTISYYADNFHSNLLIIPYDITETNAMGAPQSGYLTLANIFENPNEQPITSLQQQQQQLNNFNNFQTKTLKSLNAEYLPGICHFLKSSSCPVGIFIDRGFGQGPAMIMNSLANTNNEVTYANTVTNLSNVNLYAQSVMLIFIGGPDDREALKLAMRIARNNKVHVIIKRIRLTNETVKTPVREMNDIDYDIGQENLTFQPSAIKSTSLQTYQKMLSTMGGKRSNNNSNRVSIASERKVSIKNTANIDISVSPATPNDEDDNSGDGVDATDDGSQSNSGKSSSDSLSLLSKPSIAVSMSASEDSSSNSDLQIKQPKDEKDKLPPAIDTSVKANTTEKTSKNATSAQVETPSTPNQKQSNNPNKSSGLIKRGTFLGKIIKSRKNTIDNKRHSIASSKKSEDKVEEINGSNESFSIEIEVDTYEDRAAFNEIKKLMNKGNSHLLIEDIFINSIEQLNDISVDLVHSIDKKDLLIIGRENILPDNNIIKENDIINAKPNSGMFPYLRSIYHHNKRNI
ncbi:hypothetical protein PIROE2DRAFT_58902 [Piromyces sp. E2]|nr:hypothetical protein PIROE2DRAFT_58902 [Piromyces sp. E2]|eukprot:OUM67213.1 hypothetical protein PIROE2DRAFT_58902 [Piromyces sp. E2]